jgi:hypothetical protein
VEVVASLSQGRTAAAQCGLFTHKLVPVIFEPPCTYNVPLSLHSLLLSPWCFLSTQCNFLQSPIPSSLWGPKVYPTTQCFSLNVRDQVSHPYKTTGKIIVLYVWAVIREIWLSSDTWNLTFQLFGASQYTKTLQLNDAQFSPYYPSYILFT